MPAEVSGNGSRPSDAAAGGGVGIHLKNVSKRFGELVVLHGTPDTIAGWKALADGLLTDQPCVFHRNLEI